MRPLVPEPYRVFAFLIGLVLWLLLVAAAFISFAALGGPAWIGVVLALLPMLVVVLAWATLGLSARAMLLLSALGAVLSALVYLLFLARL
jgi:hypothetical protein